MTNNKGAQMNSREKILAYILEHGWTLDAESTIHRKFTGERVQDPHAFIRRSDADPNIVWRADLDFTAGGGWDRYTGDILKGVSIWSRQDGGRWVGERWVLNNSTAYPTPLRLVTNPSDPNAKLSLQKRAELVMANPDLYIWLAAERNRNDAEALRQARAAKSAPIPGVTVTRLDWSVLSSNLVDAAQKLREADGATDIGPLMGAVRERVAALEAVIINGGTG
jgi:hypothetical protein